MSGAMLDTLWWALLSIDVGRQSDHTMIEASSDMPQILARVAATQRWAAECAGSDAVKVGSADDDALGKEPQWHLALLIGTFKNRASADTFCRIWAQSCRGAISRVARGEALSLAFGLKAYGDFRIICRDPNVYDYIAIVDPATQRVVDAAGGSAVDSAASAIPVRPLAQRAQPSHA